MMSAYQETKKKWVEQLERSFLVLSQVPLLCLDLTTLLDELKHLLLVD